MYLYNADPDSKEWLAYQELMEDAILEGLTEAVRCSLAYLADHTDKTKNDLPIMQGSLLIEVTTTIFYLLSYLVFKLIFNKVVIF